ncbi:hypothetical protein HDU91_001126, partial [Kappamyces sp. JEL0680]
GARWGINEFIANYPIAVTGKGRESAHELLQQNERDGPVEWMDKYMILPIRARLAEVTTNQWINMRFRDDPNDPPYMPGEFLRGAEAGISAFFQSLQTEIQHPVAEHGTSTLKKLVTPQLYEALDRQHQLFHQNGLDLKLTLSSATNFEKKDNWMCFGDKTMATSSLNRAPIHTTVANNVLWRHQPGTKKWFFSEVNFEYAFNEHAIKQDLLEDLAPPTIAERGETTRKGACVGVDVLFDVDLTIVVQGTDGKESERWVRAIKRPMLVRFESGHVDGRFEGSWRIADIDKYFGSKLFQG